MCPDNKIKPTPGDATNCDIVCDGESNDEHTACGKTGYRKQIMMFIISKMGVFIYILPGNRNFYFSLFSLHIVNRKHEFNPF